MKNNKKFNCTFKVSLVAVALGLVNQAWGADFTCSNSTGCTYSFFSPPSSTTATWWLPNGTDTSLTGSINVTVPAGNYQNVARTENGTSQSGGQTIVSSRSLFSIFGENNQNNLLTLKAGVNATLKEDYTASQIVGVRHANVILEKGVNLTVEKNYSQIHNIPDAYGNSDGNSAIEINNSILDTQADIILNNDGSDAINSQSGSNIITSSNHNITMNGENNIAYLLYGKDTATIKNVNVTGNKNTQFVFDIGNDNDEATTVNADNLNASLNDKSVFMINSDGGTPTVSLNNSNVKAGYGLLVFPFGEKRTVTLNLQNSTLNATQALVSVNDKDFPIESDDDDVLDPTTAELYQLNLTGSQNSKFTGAIIENPEQPAKVEVNLALTDSQWSFNKSSQLNNLSTNNSVVTFEPTSEYKTLTIKSNLTGSGTFNLNTNIAENKGDKIIVQGTAEGNHKIGVTNQGANVADHKLTLVETKGGNAQFSLTNANNRVDLGAYQYFLSKDGNNWVLANSQNAVNPTMPEKPTTPSVTPTTPEKPTTPSITPTTPEKPTTPSVTPTTPEKPTTPSVNPSNPTLPSSPLLSDLANAQVSLRQAQLLLVESELSGIHQRLGEVKNGEKGNVWVRNVNSREKLTALSTGDSQTSGFKQNVHTLQVGADAAVTDNFRLGGFVGRSQANVDFNGNYGDGKVRSNSVGLYATYLADSGIYVDNIVKYSRFKAESDHSEKRHYNAYTVSSEIGKQFKLTGDWTITPQAQLAWTHIQGKENEDSLSSVYSRAGVRVAKGFALANGWNLQPYAEINAITSRNNNSKVHYANSALNVEDSRGRFESALGLNAGVANHRIGLEVSRADGSRYDKPYQIQAVYRYQW